MPPKKGKGKGKKGGDDDDAYWDSVAKTATPPAIATPAAAESEDEKPAFSGGSAFAALPTEDDDEGGGFGGLMSAIKKSSNKKDKKKKNKATYDEEDDLADSVSALDISKAEPEIQVVGDDEWPEDEPKSKKGKNGKKGKKGKKSYDDDDDEEEAAVEEPVVAEPEIQVAGDDEWPEDDVKPKKGKGGKKGKKGKQQTAESEDELPEPTPAAEPEIQAVGDDEWPEEDVKPKKGGKGKKGAKEEAAPSPAAEEDDEANGEEVGEVKILSKKEKEKLKKEKEKAKKKAQQAAKKAAEPEAATPEPTPAAPATEEAGDDDGEGEAGGSSDKKKNKKKKKKTTEEAPAPAPSKPLTGRMAALRAAMEAKKAAEEEEARIQQEIQLKIEQEEREAEERERAAEEAKAKKKEKEKAKKELAKKEGRLLTPKQKAEKAAAEARLQALLASGVQISGLQKDAEPSRPKKPVYGNKKKGGKGPSEPVPAPPAPKVEDVKVVEEKKAAEDDDGDDWDKSDPEPEPVKVKEKKVEEDEEDDWDASSADEEAKKPAPVSAPKAVTAPAKPAPAPAKAAPPAKPAPKGKAAPVEESSEDEDSDSGSDSDDSDSDSDDSDSDDSDSDEDSSEEELGPGKKRALAKAAEEKRAAELKARLAREKREQRHQEALAARSAEDLRSPICCIMGHVDTGKTKLLDKIRQTNVQEGEAGGITQQIGATYFPAEAIKQKTAVLNKDNTQEYKIPGLLVIDTPGHESFSNLRTRGSSLCNIAILVVDIMHGLEPQTLESLKMLRDKKTPFVVALNKIDRIYGWTATPDGAFQESLAKQTNQVKREFADRVQKTTVAFAEQGLNACLYYENKNLGRNVSLVPTSAITGEGVPDMIMLLVNLTQQRMSERLMYISELECTVLEVKVIEGLGTTIDVVLSNGYLREGDRIVVCGLNGPIFTTVRALLTPQPMREMRVKGAYVHHKEVKAALGVKITAPDLEKAIAGSRLLVVGPDDDEEDLGDEVMSDLQNLLTWVDKSGRGVSVQASTLGSLEALLDFLKVSKIPVSTINIGPVHKRDVIQASTMVEKSPEHAVMLCFDVTVDKEAEKLAEEAGVKIFKAEIIYHLFDAFTAHMKAWEESQRAAVANQAFWPCRLKILQVFARRDPVVLGVDILDGTLRTGTPVCVVKTDTDNTTSPPTVTKTIVDLGTITSIEKNHESYEKLTRKNIGAGAAIKIEAGINAQKVQVGRHFEETDDIYSKITRKSIDVLKEHFRAEAQPSDWTLIKKLKPLLDIP